MQKSGQHNTILEKQSKGGCLCDLSGARIADSDNNDNAATSFTVEKGGRPGIK
jgi:hypothetical protein